MAPATSRPTLTDNPSAEAAADPQSTSRTAVTFQQAAAGPDGQSPWPVTFEGGRIIHGRPDAGHIIGFTEPGVQSVKVVSFDLTPENVESVIGLWPVFTGREGGMFSDSRPVTSIRFRELSAEAVASLEAREAEFTAALLGVMPSKPIRYELGDFFPTVKPGLLIEMYGEVWRYNGPDDWERIKGIDGSADPDHPNYDSVGTMDDDEMAGQTFTVLPEGADQ